MIAALLLGLLSLLPTTASSLLCQCSRSYATRSDCTFPNRTCETSPKGSHMCMTEFVIDGDGNYNTEFDCVHSEWEANVVCRWSDTKTKVIRCCNDTSLCNQQFSVNPLLDTTDEMTSSTETDPTNYIGAIVGVPLICLTIVLTIPLVIGTFVCLRHRKRRLEITHHPNMGRDLSPISSDISNTCPFNEITDTSGSGFGLPHLEQRTIARSIKLGETIGTGRFGLVLIGDFQGEKVAVKKFASIDGQSWTRETEIYQTVLLTHDSILRFVSSDMISNAGVTELWLITQYHPNGSLHDYLNQREVSPKVMLQMAISICSGLAHLHTELFGTITKTAIAHRDMKSKNILVKSNLTCCIADFGLAVMKTRDNGVNIPTNPKQGTKRYMAPEILEETINMNYFESFKQTDVYSSGLVLWELCRRCVGTSGSAAMDYELPFQGLVPSDPSFEDMRRIVVVEKRQPQIPSKWFQDELLRNISNLIRECWHQRGNARPTVVYLKKKLNRFSQEDKLDYEKTIE